uniref:Lipoprotein n=1 Tax=viral metagenome TaxID=1070528 RepID=A0A6M3LT11_9ZZZZ
MFKKQKWILTIITILVIIIGLSIMSGCQAGFNIGPNGNPYSDSNFDIQRAK